MLEKIFLQILNMSFTSSIVIVFVLLARLLLKKTPKIFSYALWSIVLFRLVCPFSFESVFSLLPTKANPIAQNIVYMQTPTIDTGITAINNSVNALLPAAIPTASVNPLQIWVFIGSVVWVIGIVILLGYSLVTLLLLKKRLKTAVLHMENIFLSDRIDTAFVLGVFHPKIYLPVSLTDGQRQYILLHEQTHINRFDHLVKLLSFFVLCLYWFNPFVWIAFFASGKDMELSCDEAVVRKLGNEIKKDYSTSLLTLATGRRIVSGTPLAFGEGDTKGRIKNVLNYKKPKLWLVGVTSLICILAVFCFVSNPIDGTIKTAVDPHKKPAEHEQSNFGFIGSQYVLGNDLIHVNIDGKWIVFEVENQNTPTAEYAIAMLDKNGSLSWGIATNGQLAQDILMNVLVKSAAWEGVDISTLEEYFLIRQTFSETHEVHDYYAYRLPDGTAVLQTGTNGQYSILSEELYESLAKYVIYPNINGNSWEVDKDTNYSQSLNAEDLAQTEAVVRNYFTVEAPYYEGVVSIELMPNDSALYQNPGIEGKYEAGNIIIYKVLTGRDKKDHNPERTASVARTSRDAAWEIVNQGY